uniref:Coiled-coil domain-containing protein 50 n=1 Tax=Bactrocera latifrons TaxID=174628 RepID=A0A0K8TZZ4_BACLA
MNNLTKTELLPKSGHVNEVCKEWLVREDSALAYKLQSQEINDFYKGNRQRNAVVREDFPTALNEQIKEKEEAEKQVEMYRRRLLEQEAYDKRVAKEIADKLERDLQEQRQRELLESEEMAQQMQELYVNLPPPTRGKAQLPPPRPAKASILQQNPNEPSTSNGRYFGGSSSSSQHTSSHQQLSQSPQTPQQSAFQPYYKPQQQQQHELQQSSPESYLLQQNHFSQTDCYVGISIQKSPSLTAAAASTSAADAPSPPTSSTRKTAKSQASGSSHLLQQHQHSLSSISTGSTASGGAAASAAIMASPSASVQSSTFAHQHPHQHNHQHLHAPAAQQQQQKRNALDMHHPTHTPYTNHSPTHTTTTTPTGVHQQPLHQHQHSVEELVDYSDVVDSIRQLNGEAVGHTPESSPIHNTFSNNHPNPSTGALSNRLHSVSNENLLRNEHKFQKLSPEKYDQLVGNDGSGRGMPNAVAAERHMQAHADDIELYVDPCDYASLKEIGLPMEEIKEMSKKLKQEQKDELLARRLQQMEAHDGLTQEERDRLMAIEAQDKELAKMLQDRERAKAKRAKEKARLRKHQQKDGNTTLCSSNGSSSNGLHCGPLLPLPQDCLSFGKHSSHAAHSPTAAAANNFSYAPQPAARNGLHVQAEEQEEADIIDVEAYSNPIDVLHNQQQRQQQNGTLTNGSLSREGGRRSNGSQHNGIGAHPNSMLLNRGEDDIYTLPVDSCRPGQRPTSLNISATSDAHLLQHNSMTRSENYSIDSHDSLNRHELAPRMNYSQSSTFGIYIKAQAPHRLICRFRVRDAQTQATSGKRNRRISVRISEAATN